MALRTKWLVRAAALTILLTSSVWAQAPAGNDAVWKQFFDWFQQGDYEQNTPERYRAKLIADGMTEAEADQRIELLGNLAPGHQSDFTALFFNRIYAAPTPQFNTAPNAFLVDMTAGLKPGTALDAAMGQGRNAIYLASKGWHVTGFDIAEKGLELAQAEAVRRGLRITTVKSNHTDFNFGHERWDLIVFSYAWAPLLAPEFVNRVRESMKPGGLVLIEQPAEEPAGSRDPIDEVNALLKAWGGFRILRYEDTLGQWDWRIRKARVLRLLAQKGSGRFS